MTLVAHIDGSVIADNSLTANELAPSVGSSELADNSVDTAALQDSSVTSAKVGAGQIDDTHIVTGGLGTSSICKWCGNTHQDDTERRRY